MYYYFWGSLRTLKQLRVGEGGSKVGSRSARMVYEYFTWKVGSFDPAILSRTRESREQ